MSPVVDPEDCRGDSVTICLNKDSTAHTELLRSPGDPAIFPTELCGHAILRIQTRGFGRPGIRDPKHRMVMSLEYGSYKLQGILGYWLFSWPKTTQSTLETRVNLVKEI